MVRVAAPTAGKSTLAAHVFKCLVHSIATDPSFKPSSGKSSTAEPLCSLAWQIISINTPIEEEILFMQKENHYK